MIQGIMIRGTTPKHDFSMPYSVDEVEDIRITYGQNNKTVLTKIKKDCSIEKDIISLRLTQQDTLSFIPNKNIYIEIRILLSNNQVVQTEEPIVLRVINTMNTEVLG